MSEWLELDLQIQPDPVAETALVKLVVNLAMTGTEARVTKATRTWLVSLGTVEGTDDVDAWVVTMLGQVYAGVTDRYYAQKQVMYPNTSGRT